ncbi:hypothetical protein J2X31_003707 [Flavobacterium arsenatis]|uniref:Uncharacterized protein n=1 Tax=Flavobacterium arsenatis TaxID=1484332 RepID=A0ABU1TUW7_9FLAO|nr:hypothetical protein [Flavobacterium arsenatis]MDR6969673.1 hypothetical protein [Flavobacterium arsenatis]
MKNKKKYFLSIALIIIIVISYLNTNFYIKTMQWKYNNGFHVGDWIVFDDANLNYRTIYDGQKPIGKIVFCYGKGLIIKDIITSEKGFYTNKGDESN